jgi:hypothetical protein
MPTARLRRYRRFPAIPDALALVKLLRRAAIAFETRYERGANYDRTRHEPDRLEVWIRAADYAYVQRLEAALTREQALALAADALPADQWRSLVAQAAPRPIGAGAAARNALTHQSILSGSAASSTIILGRWLFGLLTLSGLAALAFYWSK